MIVQVGDLHLDDSNSWSLPVSAAVVQTLIQHPQNLPDSTWIFSGDLTDRSIVSGSVTALLKTLFDGLRGQVYIVRGNHDIKEKNGILSTPYSPFLTSRITEVSRPTIKTIEGMIVALLPHLHPSQSLSNKDYERTGKCTIDERIDILIGHFADTSQPTIFDNLIDISYVDATYVSLGHIHNPIGSNYIGSVIPNKVSEAKQVRKLRLFEKQADGIRLSEYRLPRISDYYDVEYPNPLPDSSSCLFPIYTIHNCSDEQLARRLYGSIYIRKCLYDASTNFDLFVQSQQDAIDDDFLTIDYKSTMDSWLSEIDATQEVREAALAYLTN